MTTITTSDFSYKARQYAVSGEGTGLLVTAAELAAFSGLPTNDNTNLEFAIRGATDRFESESGTILRQATVVETFHNSCLNEELDEQDTRKKGLNVFVTGRPFDPTSTPIVRVNGVPLSGTPIYPNSRAFRPRVAVLDIAASLPPGTAFDATDFKLEVEYRIGFTTANIYDDVKMAIMTIASTMYQGRPLVPAYIQGAISRWRY